MKKKKPTELTVTLPVSDPNSVTKLTPLCDLMQVNNLQLYSLICKAPDFCISKFSFS